LNAKGIEVRESAAQSLRSNMAFKVSIANNFASQEKGQDLLGGVKHIVISSEVAEVVIRCQTAVNTLLKWQRDIKCDGTLFRMST
jgi:hypothetical protein